MKRYMKRAYVTLITLLILFVHCGDKQHYVNIETDLGDMKVMLYNSTPKHRDNFLKLAKDGFYDGLLFHRIINGFMVQGGDPDSKNAAADQMLGQGGPGYQIDAEIGELHAKGALSAARLGDNVNPEKKSSGSQFFIVHGYKVAAQELQQWEAQKGLSYTDEEKNMYQDGGGYPFLDGDYTVFGKVVEGLDVIDKIAAVTTGTADRPVEDIQMTISISK
ncbi:MAG: peptidylprolyl isomerase [Saprospiraceae bacterium]|nr:peptidylprolyl isomerase [Saprospiraceae bacterium]